MSENYETYRKQAKTYAQAALAAKLAGLDPTYLAELAHKAMNRMFVARREIWLNQYLPA